MEGEVWSVESKIRDICVICERKVFHKTGFSVAYYNNFIFICKFLDKENYTFFLFYFFSISFRSFLYLFFIFSFTLKSFPQVFNNGF